MPARAPGPCLPRGAHVPPGMRVAPGTRSPRAVAVAAALLLHAAVTLALALNTVDPAPSGGARGIAAAAAEGPAVLWVRWYPPDAGPAPAPAPAALPAALPTLAGPTTPSADAAQPAAGAAWRQGDLVRAGERLQLDYPDIEIPMPGLHLVLDLRLDAARQVVTVSGPDQGLRGVVRQHAEQALLGAALADLPGAQAQRVCLHISLDPNAGTVQWQALLPPRDHTRACPLRVAASAIAHRTSHIGHQHQDSGEPKTAANGKRTG